MLQCNLVGETLNFSSLLYVSFCYWMLTIYAAPNHLPLSCSGTPQRKVAILSLDLTVLAFLGTMFHMRSMLLQKNISSTRSSLLKNITFDSWYEIPDTSKHVSLVPSITANFCMCSYMSKSTGRGALSIWTHHLKETEWFEHYKTDDYSGPAVTVQSGVQGFQIYAEANIHGLTIVGEMHMV